MDSEKKAAKTAMDGIDAKLARPTSIRMAR